MASTSKPGSNGGVGKRLLNVKEAAGYLGLQVDTIYKKSRLPEIPSVKVGRALRFDVMELDRFIREHAVETIGCERELLNCQFMIWVMVFSRSGGEKEATTAVSVYTVARNLRKKFCAKNCRPEMRIATSMSGGGSIFG
jgi:excisionase family DNA binding protein